MYAMAFIIISWLVIAFVLLGLVIGLHRLLGLRAVSPLVLLTGVPVG